MALQIFNMTQNIPGQAPQRAGWQSLPAELRRMIYPLTWESRKIVVASKATEGKPPYDMEQRVEYDLFGPELPVTPRLNFKARDITLRHYIPISRRRLESEVAEGTGRQGNHQTGG